MGWVNVLLADYLSLAVKRERESERVSVCHDYFLAAVTAVVEREGTTARKRRSL